MKPWHYIVKTPNVSIYFVFNPYSYIHFCVGGKRQVKEMRKEGENSCLVPEPDIHIPSTGLVDVSHALVLRLGMGITEIPCL